MTTCEGCGFDYGSVRPAEFPGALTETAHRFQAALLDADVDELRRRPDRQTWSPLEYACHVRDVLLVQRERVYLALVEDGPSVTRMYREERAVLARYDAQVPAMVAADLGFAARLLARAFSDLEEGHWQRPLVYNYPGPEEHDIAWLGAHTLHELRHHLADITAELGRSPGT